MDVRGKRVTVVGLGRTAMPLVRLLLREGALPFITERAEGPRYAPLCQELDDLGVPYELGGHTDAAVASADWIIPSPGVPLNIPIIRQAVEAGAGLASELEFAFAHCRSKLVAVTGTNGKTTTTELLYALIKACGFSASLAGNNACPFSEAVMRQPAPEYLVLEVSSYQLEAAHAFRPWAGVVLNVTADHLERHGTLEAYALVKSRMFVNQEPGDISVVNADDPLVARMARKSQAQVLTFSLESPQEHGLWVDGATIRHGAEEIGSVDGTPLPGRHNLQNVLAALCVMRAGGFDWPKVLEGLAEFRGVEHRIEHVATIDGADFYNDSKSTNIDSLKVALESFSRPIVLIAGGLGKGAPYEALRELVSVHVKRLVTLGEDAPKLEEAFSDLVPCERASDMADAVQRAGTAAAEGDIVLLSPACASFDMFDDFEHRGRVFKKIVTAYAAQRGQGPSTAAPSGRESS